MVDIWGIIHGNPNVVLGRIGSNFCTSLEAVFVSLPFLKLTVKEGIDIRKSTVYVMQYFDGVTNTNNFVTYKTLGVKQVNPKNEFLFLKHFLRNTIM